MMKYWRLTWDQVMDQSYINAMMLNACIPSYEDKEAAPSTNGISLFELGEKLAGIK